MWSSELHIQSDVRSTQLMANPQTLEQAPHLISYSKILLCRSHMKTFYVQFVDRCWTPKKIGATCYFVLINSEHSTPVEKYLNTAHRFFKLLCGQNSINPKIFVVLFLSSCTKFSKNSNVSMGSQKQGRKDQSQTRIREKCNDTHSSQVG